MKFKTTQKVKSLTFGTDSARKRDFHINTTTRPTMDTASYWSEGSRDYFTVINFRNGTVIHPPGGSYPMFKAEYTLQPGEVMMNTGIFCGKPMSARFTCLPDELVPVMAWLGLDSWKEAVKASL